MSDEIKEILDKYLNSLISYPFQRKDKEYILDYITNLQQELEDYKSRVEKAVEYIMNELITEWDIKNDGYVHGSDLPADAITPLLNILQDTDDSNLH